MANTNQVELVVTVEVDKANQSIKSVNAGLSSIESAASKAARGASQGLDSMTASMIKGATAGNLLADAIKKAVEWLKEWTIDAAKLAAHEERLTHAGEALAKAHGIAADAFRSAVEEVKALGIHGEDALVMVNKLIVADVGIEKAKGLATLAKNLAAIGNTSVPEAMESIVRSIETGQARALKASGLVVDFTRQEQIAELKLGRTLSENEAIQMRYAAVMKAGQSIQGAWAASAGDAEMQSKKLGVELEELKEAVGAEFQDEFKKVIAMLRDLVGALKDHPDVLVKFGEGAMWAAAAITTYGLAAKIGGVTKAVTALNAALAANPWALALTGIAAGGAIIYSTWKDTQAGLEAKGREMNLAGIRNQIGSGASLADLKKRGFSEDDIRAAMGADRGVGGAGLGIGGVGGPKVKIGGGGEPDLDALKMAAELRKQQIGNEKFFAGRAAEAAGAGKTGYAKEVADLNAAIQKQTAYTDDKGIQHFVALTKSAWQSIMTELSAKWAAFKDKVADDNRKNVAEYVKGQEDAHAKVMEMEAARYQQRLQNDIEIANRNMEHVKATYEFQAERAGFERDAALRKLDGTDAVTLEQKAALEQRKADIEIEYIQKVHAVKEKLFDIETQQMVLDERLALERLGYRADEISARVAELQGQRAEIARMNDEATDSAVQAARENAANRAAEIVRDHNRQVFESLKQQAGGVFDALLTKSQSVWQSIANSFKTAVLTAIKEIVTSRVAAALMALFGGGRASFAAGGGAGGGGGLLGGLGGLLGAGAGGGGLFGSGASGGGMIFSAAGGGPSGAGGGGGLLGGLLGGKGGSGASLAGLKDFLGFGGGVQYAPGQATTWAASTFGQKLSALGRSNAALLGGGLLAFDGLRRGGLLGMGETTAGGAMIGFKYGGPVGALIGGAVGLAAGIGRLFIHGATEKAREKIKSLYGVNVTDKGVLNQIVQMVKEGFGGNFDVGLRSPQVRELVQLYAMTTGQPAKGMPATMQSLTMSETGGSLYSMPNYQNGVAQGGITALDTIGRGAASGASGVTIQLDGPATTALLRGEAVSAIQTNTRKVASATVSAMKSNASRRQLTTLQLSPGLITN